jgi:hypothetical protein
MLEARFPLLAAAVAAAMASNALAQGNDECAGAIQVVAGPNGPFTNSSCTTSAPAWLCASGANDVWFYYVPATAGPVTVDTCGADYDSALEVFDATAGCGNLVSMGCNDDACGLQSAVTFTAVACTPYYVRVGGFAGDVGEFPLNINGPGTCAGVATAVPQGAGCLAQFTSFYELFATSSVFDLGNNSLTLTNTGTAYAVTLGGGTYQPVGSLSTPTTLSLPDDGSIVAGTLGLEVCSNGWVALAPGNSTSWSVAVPVMLGNPAAAWYAWHDMNPTLPGSGQVKYEQSGAQAQVTFDGVWDYGGTSAADANNIQFQINTATGNVVICWGFMSTLGASGVGHLVGYSPGGASADPGNRDLSALTALVTFPADAPPLSLAGIGRPVQGASAVNYDVTTGNIPASALIHLGVVGLVSPSVPLIFLGMPGCFLNSSLDVLVGPVVFPPASVTWTALNLPSLPPAFVGFQFNAQGVIMGTPLNTAFGVGALTSNGMQMTVGAY